AGLPLESVAHVPVVKVDARRLAVRGLGAEAFADVDVAGKAVLVNTDWSRYWRMDRYFENNPYLTAGACELLVAHGARFVGIDSLNIDDIEDPSRPAHTILLGAGVPICEHMTNLCA